MRYVTRGRQNESDVRPSTGELSEEISFLSGLGGGQFSSTPHPGDGRAAPVDAKPRDSTTALPSIGGLRNLARGTDVVPRCLARDLNQAYSIDFVGEPGRIRTFDPLIKSHIQIS